MSSKHEVRDEYPNRYARNAMQESQLAQWISTRAHKTQVHSQRFISGQSPERERGKRFMAIIIIIIFTRARVKVVFGARRYTQVHIVVALGPPVSASPAAVIGQTTTNELLTRMDFDSTRFAGKESFAFQPSLSLDEVDFSFSACASHIALAQDVAFSSILIASLIWRASGVGE